MSINFKAPENIVLKPIITVFGVGGAGGNAVNNMLAADLQGANFVVANTDAQSLKHSLCENKIQLGANSTRGLGAGASPEVGAAAAEESADEIKGYLTGSNMVFITAGMGGGTGTGASPIVAGIAKELGILTVGVVTKPFNFEGQYRMKTAEKGLSELQQFVDTLIVIPNQNLFRIANERTTFADAFKMADDVLHAGVRGVTDLMIMPGLINLDFADIRAVMSEMGKAMMGTGEASGEDRAVKAAEAAISNPLLDHSSMCGARGVLINITGGVDMTLFEVDSAANRIRSEVGDTEANIIFGSTFNPDLNGLIRVSVVATGIDASEADTAKYQQLKSQSEQETQDVNDLLDTLETKINQMPGSPDVDTHNINDNVLALDNETQYDGNNNIANEAVDKNIYVRKSTLYRNNVTPPKQSFISKMWNSLKANDQSMNTSQNKFSPNLEEKPGDGKNFIASQGISKNNNELEDVPAFLRKKTPNTEKS